MKKVEPDGGHDIFVTPRGTGAISGMPIEYGVIESSFGNALAGISRKGLCNLMFFDNHIDDAVSDLADNWPGARLSHAPEVIQALASDVFSADGSFELALHLMGTEFQILVWRALMKIPGGTTVSYRDVAQLIGRPTATRAVANAIGRNTLAVLIPCHRVRRTDGSLGKYRWGAKRKQAILDSEQSS